MTGDTSILTEHMGSSNDMSIGGDDLLHFAIPFAGVFAVRPDKFLHGEMLVGVMPVYPGIGVEVFTDSICILPQKFGGLGNQTAAVYSQFHHPKESFSIGKAHLKIHLLQVFCNSILVIAADHNISGFFYGIDCIAHGNTGSTKFQHTNVRRIVTKCGHIL